MSDYITAEYIWSKYERKRGKDETDREELDLMEKVGKQVRRHKKQKVADDLVEEDKEYMKEIGDANFMFMDNKMQEAKSLLVSILKRNQTSVRANALLSTIYQQEGKHLRALKHLILSNQYSDNPDWLNCAKLAYQAGNFKDALFFYKKVGGDEYLDDIIELQVEMGEDVLNQIENYKDKLKKPHLMKIKCYYKQKMYKECKLEILPRINKILLPVLPSNQKSDRKIFDALTDDEIQECLTCLSIYCEIELELENYNNVIIVVNRLIDKTNTPDDILTSYVIAKINAKQDTVDMFKMVKEIDNLEKIANEYIKLGRDEEAAKIVKNNVDILDHGLSIQISKNERDMRMLRLRQKLKERLDFFNSTDVQVDVDDINVITATICAGECFDSKFYNGYLVCIMPLFEAYVGFSRNITSIFNKARNYEAEKEVTHIEIPDLRYPRRVSIAILKRSFDENALIDLLDEFTEVLCILGANNEAGEIAHNFRILRETGNFGLNPIRFKWKKKDSIFRLCLINIKIFLSLEKYRETLNLIRKNIKKIKSKSHIIMLLELLFRLTNIKLLGDQGVSGFLSNFLKTIERGSRETDHKILFKFFAGHRFLRNFSFAKSLDFYSQLSPQYINDEAYNLSMVAALLTKICKDTTADSEEVAEMFGYFGNYQKTSKNPSEARYNLARFMQQLGLNIFAQRIYYDIISQNGEYKNEAIHNLAVMSGDAQFSRSILQENFTIEY
jgi:hypothetical protein